MRHTEPTLADLEQNFDNIAAAVNAYFVARAYAETVREAIHKIDISILRDEKTGKWLYRTDPARLHGRENMEFITDPERAYMMSDDDAADYYAERDKRIHENGWNVKKGYCPALIAESLQRDAERLIVSTTGPLFGIDANDLLCAKNGLEQYRKFIDLTCKMVASHPRYKPSLVISKLTTK